MEKDAAAETSEQTRQKHECPFPSCNAKVVHLPRHMRQMHKWDKSRSTDVLSMFDLRKKVKNSEATTSAKLTKKQRVHKR